MTQPLPFVILLDFEKEKRKKAERNLFILMPLYAIHPSSNP